MEWRKLKNIILLILLALNAALAILIGGPALSDHYRDLQADREAAAFLEQKGIQFGDTVIPNPEDLFAQNVVREREAEAHLARKLLGDDVVQEARGGEVYRYTSNLGMVQFHSDGSFWAQLVPGAFPTGDDPQGTAIGLLEQLEFSGQIVTLEEAGENTVTVRQVWDGAHLFNQQATVIWNDDEIMEITAGRRLYGTPVADETRRTITLATALIDFYNGLNRLGDVCSRVDEIIPGYISTTSLTRQMELTPVWRITTDTGAYQLDLVSGDVERVS